MISRMDEAIQKAMLEIQSLKEQSTGFQSQIVALTQANNQLKLKLTSITHEHLEEKTKTKSLQADIVHKDEALEALRKRLENLKPELAQANLKLKNTENQLRELQDLHAECAANHQAQVTENEQVWQEATMQREQRLREDLQQKIETIAALRREVDTLTSEYLRKNAELQRDRDRFAGLKDSEEQRVKSIVESLYKSQTLNTKLEGDVAKLSKDKSALLDELARCKLRVDTTARHVEQLEELLVQKEQIYTKESAQTRQNIENLVLELKQLAQTNQILEQRLNTATNEHQTRLTSLQKDNEDKTAEIVFLLQQIHALKTAVHKQVSKIAG